MNRKLLRLSYSGLFILICSLNQNAVASRDNADWYGVWWRGGQEAKAMKENYPWIKGVFVGMDWALVEPEPGKFDWDYFKGELTRYAEAGLYIQFIVKTGGDAPRWLFENGVPEVVTTPTINPRGQPHGWTYPYYMDPDYQQYYWRMIRQVAEMVDRLPGHVRKMIISLQTAEGTTGDGGPYKGTPLNPEYIIEESEWMAFKYKTWKLYDRLYRIKSPRIFLLINSGNKGEYHDWLMDNMPDTWRKAGNPGHGYQLNAELGMMEFLDPIINHPGEEGAFVRCRSEMDERHKGWFAEAPVWNQYWLNLWGLHFGLDILQHGTDAFKNPLDFEGFEFYSKYGGRKVPEESPGAFCALRDGLDAADYDRFPIEIFGPGEFNPRASDQSIGIQRSLNIVEQFKAFGARQGDPYLAMKRTMQNRSAEAMNDVGWEIWPGNYERYLTQIAPRETSQGWWRVGDKDQPYGRFARSARKVNGTAAMYFDVDDAFAKSLSGSVCVRVVYFDEGTNNWELLYGAQGKQTSKAISVKKTNTLRWMEKTVIIDGFGFNNNCALKSDLILKNLGDEQTKIHMIEVIKM